MGHLRRDSGRIRNFLACLWALALLVAGCSHSRKAEDSGFARLFAPQPPAFLTGPACVLLTNNGGFSARVTVETEDLVDRQNGASGQLFCRGSKLFYAPEPKGADGKPAREGGFGFVWDGESSSGYVLSEALQGYAPFTSAQRVTNLLVQPKGLPDKSVSQGADSSEVTVQMSDGRNPKFQVWRAMGLNGLPLRISTLTNAVAFPIRLSNVRPGPAPADLFVPPNGFTKYSSPEALVDELAARKLNLRRKSAPEPFTGPQKPSY